MRSLPLMLCCVLLGSLAPRAAAAEACQAGGFAIEADANGKILTGKADSTFNVAFDGTYYKANDFEDALKASIDAWSTISGSNWKYKFTGYANGADQESGTMSIVKGGLTLPGSVLATTLVTWSASSGQIVDSDIYFNPAQPINTNPSKIEFDFQRIALHEMGHGLGLDHNDQCTGPQTVMYPFLSLGEKGHDLFQQELDGVRFLYSGSNPPGGVAAAPWVLNFQGPIDGPAPPAQTTTLTGVSGQSWSVTSADSWITVTPASGTFPATVTVQVNPRALTDFGPHIGQVVLTAGKLSTTLYVLLNATTLPAPLLTLSPGALSFQALQGGPNPASQPLDVLGQTGLAWTAQVPASATWLRLSSTSGRIPTTLSAQVSSAGLAPGIYTAAITFTAAGVSQQTQVQFELAAQPRVVVSPAQVSLSQQTGSNGLFCSRVAVTGFAGSRLDWVAGADQPWVTLLPASGTTPADLLVCATAGSLKPGSYTAAATVSSSSPASAQAIAVAFTVTPAVGAPGVVNAATGNKGGVAAGEILSLFASNLASGAGTASGFPLPTQLAGTTVLVGGVKAPLLYVSPTQINLVAPSILSNSVGTTTTVVVYNGSLASPTVEINVVKTAPSIFSVTGLGASTAAVTHNNGTLVTRAAPMVPGEPVSVYLTGLGTKSPAVADGAAAPANQPLAAATGNVHVRFDGQDAPVIFAGAAPNFAGLDVVVVTVPASLNSQSPKVTVQVDEVLSDPIPVANF